MSVRLLGTVPNHYRKVVATDLSRDFRRATKVVSVEFPALIKPTEIVVRNLYAGVNASDINYTAGVYKPNLKPPFDCGFEGLGQVVGLGASVSNLAIHDFVLTQSFGTFSEYQVVPNRNARKVPRPDPAYLALELSGVTASICLEQVLQPQPKETALVTAAAGGTGQFAVQLLKKKYGCHVIGTCSNRTKAEFLKRIGVDRVVLYTEEKLDDVLRNEYRNGVNVVYESVGGAMFDTALKHLATRGRLGVIGNVVGYKDGSSFGETSPTKSGEAAEEQGENVARSGYRPGAPIGSTLLWKSASVRGFFLPHFAKYVGQHFEQLSEMVDRGEIESTVDPAVFRGCSAAADAVDHLLSGQSCGKVVLKLEDFGSLV
jgi:NADPH-dependent curcumin reductase CurA